MKERRYTLYNENLQSTSEEVIKNLICEIEDYQTAIKIVLVILAIALTALCTLSIQYMTLSNKYKIEEQNNEIIKQEQEQEQEQELSLEYAIGYWLINTPDSVNDDILYDFLLENNAWYPEILLAQAKLESGNYTSNIFKSNNNLYGMRKVYRRPTTQQGDDKGYGYYSNWCLSVLDRILWDKFTFENKPSKDEYLRALRGYANDPYYIEKLLWIEKK
jgi:hypothetical protein